MDRLCRLDGRRRSSSGSLDLDVEPFKQRRLDPDVRDATVSRLVHLETDAIAVPCELTRHG